MDNASSNTVPAKRKRGRPRKYPTSEAKATADVERRRTRRQAPVQRNTVHAHFHNPGFPLLPLQSGGGTGWMNVFSNSYSPANPNAPEPDNTDISQFLPTTMSDIGTFAGAEDSISMSNHESPDPGQAIAFDTTLETSPQAENDEPDPVEHLARELADQLIQFQGCCNDCYQAAQRNRMEDPNEQIGLAMYLEFAPELGPDVLGTETIARQKDDLAGKMSPESRRDAFYGLGSRAEIITLHLLR
ncbi:hypothetical protein EDB81DRAFT_767188 [Dactylonectria macrodidyma]|uniref:Uncharacterized protein n=1 Tax=Dactylonectria macrodidyma TaxID=307937 RepID=A0A9P9IF08_9HYPO|nr:hypothetical protein EDB81DRAFT_767188 [Dactylonectria macrodidyma]